MLLTILILSSLLGLYYRDNIYRLCLKSVLFVLKGYVYILNKVSCVLPTFIFIKMHTHQTIDTDFSVHEYYYNFKGRFHRFKMVESPEYNINDYFGNIDLNSLYDIHHACVLNRNGEYVKDITKDIRYFMHLRNIVEWKYILVHIGIENEEVMVIHKNDEDLSEKLLHIGEIYNEIFNF